ncbi:MAG: hypothetical protein RL071_3564 [Pseudomonadota bacterium]
MRTSKLILCVFPMVISACVGEKEIDEGDSGTAGDGGAGDGGAGDGGGEGGSGGDCVDGLTTLSGVYTSDLSLSPEACPAYLLSGGVFIGDPESAGNSNTLTIAPGTVIYGDNATKGFLAVQRGARIVAEGTADAPIIFTSALPEGSRSRGDWGGIIVNGKAPINNCSDGTSESLPCEAESEGDAGTYGGDDPTDSSGSLKYVRIEFGGIDITPENQVNGLALQGVGSGTSVSYVQVHMNLDDGVEFFGGTVQADHLLITGAGDDQLDWTDGWTGGASEVCIQQGADIGDRGIEADNNEDENNALPRSTPTLRNLTIIGAAEEGVGMTLRRGTSADIDGLILSGFGKACLDVDDDATYGATGLSITNSVLACATNFAVDDEEPSDASLEAGFLSGDGNVATSPLRFSGFTASGDLPTAGCLAGGDWTTGWTTAAMN